jgi:hypothetical protein
MKQGQTVGLVLSLLFLAGCGAPLTKPQVAAVASFHDATHQFVLLPGSVVRAYEQVRTENGILDLATEKIDLTKLDPGKQQQAIERTRNRLKRVLERGAERVSKARGYVLLKSQISECGTVRSLVTGG